MWLSCVILASKILVEPCLKNSCFARICGLNLMEVNLAEIMALNGLDYRLNIPAEFDRYSQHLKGALCDTTSIDSDLTKF